MDKSPNCNPFFIPNKVSLGHLLISFPNNQPLLNSVFEVVLTIIVKQNFFWKNVVGESKTCVASINAFAEEKVNFCLLTMHLWPFKSNYVWLIYFDKLRGIEHKSTHWLINSQKYNNYQAHQFINFQTLKLINLSIQNNTNSSTHQYTKLKNRYFYFTISL